MVCWNAHIFFNDKLLYKVSGLIQTWPTFWSLPRGFNVKRRSHVLFVTDKREKKNLSPHSQKLQNCFRPRNRGDYCDSARIPSPPHPSQAQRSSEHTLLRQTPEFQRHLIELLRLLTSTAKYCQGISRLCCGHWKLSVVGNLWGERVQGGEEQEEKDPPKKLKLCKSLETE